MKEVGAGSDVQTQTLINRTGGTLVPGDVVSMNDLGTDTTYDTVDGTDNDVDKNVVAIVAADINTRKRVALETIANGERGLFAVSGRVRVKVASLAANCVMGARLTTSNAAADGSTVVAKQLHARLDNSGTGPINGLSAAQQTFGITKEATTNTAAVVWCDFRGDGEGIVGV
jgi:hypothetical protein